jgi:3'-5' exoribonuclease
LLQLGLMLTSPETSTIQAIKQATSNQQSFPAILPAQIEKRLLKETAAGKPYYELLLRDLTGTLTLRAWSDKPSFRSCEIFQEGDFLRIEGNFQQQGSFGVDAPGWQATLLPEEEKENLLLGSPQKKAQMESFYQKLEKIIETIQEPRLQELCKQFLLQYEERFRRAAAARMHHHAYAGGLLKHTVAMLQTADAIAQLYPQLHRDLLIAGVLFHDSGKLWETGIGSDDLTMKPQIPGELLGHITIGIELVNNLWRNIPATTFQEWKKLTPSSEEVRLHLLHLIAAHHGCLEFGSPILPKTPEAIALHFIDNLDAKLEMFEEAYNNSSEIAPNIFDKNYPLGVSPIRSLHKGDHHI